MKFSEYSINVDSKICLIIKVHINESSLLHFCIKIHFIDKIVCTILHDCLFKHTSYPKVAMLKMLTGLVNNNDQQVPKHYRLR